MEVYCYGFVHWSTINYTGYYKNFFNNFLENSFSTTVVVTATVVLLNQ